MDSVAGLLANFNEKPGQTFLLVGFVPVLVLLAGLQVIVPGLSGALNLFAEGADPVLGPITGEQLSTVILALVGGVAPLLLNRTIITLYEGIIPLRNAPELLNRFYRMKVHGTYYNPIHLKREERLAMLAEYEDDPAAWDEDRDDDLQDAIEEHHEMREATPRAPELPVNPDFLRPTRFGNAWAIAESTPRDRYGLDGVLFWPPLRTIAQQDNPELIDTIDDQKLLMDAAIHLAAVLAVLTLTALGTMVWAIATGAAWWQWAIGVAGLFVLHTLFYRAATSTVQTIGVYMAQVYDLYRYELLDALGIARPETARDEYFTWQRLAAFIRRGEPFYLEYLDFDPARAGRPCDDDDDD